MEIITESVEQFAEAKFAAARAEIAAGRGIKARGYLIMARDFGLFECEIPMFMEFSSPKNIQFLSAHVNTAYEFLSGAYDNTMVKMHLVAVVVVADILLAFHPDSLLNQGKPLPKVSELPDREESVYGVIYQKDRTLHKIQPYGRYGTAIIFKDDWLDWAVLDEGKRNGIYGNLWPDIA